MGTEDLWEISEPSALSLKIKGGGGARVNLSSTPVPQTSNFNVVVILSF